MKSLVLFLTGRLAKNTQVMLGMVLILTAIAAYFRLWNFTNTLMFQGDQGRDALVVSNIFREANPVFIGPVTSIGNMYLGPFYYYFMLPWLWLTYPNPSGPAIAVAITSILTVPLLYFVGLEMLSKRAALWAAAGFAFSSTAITFARFSWNPNLTPILSLLMVFFTFRAIKRSPWYWIAVSICFSLLIQLHYIVLLLAAGAGIAWLWQLREILLKRALQKTKTFAAATLGSLFIFLLSLTPLFLFDIKHDQVNLSSLQKLFTQEKAFSPVNPTLAGTLAQWGRDFFSVTQQIMIHDVFTTHIWVSILIFIGLIGALFFIFRHITAKKTENTGLLQIIIFLVTSFIGLALYQHQIYPHYYLYLLPLVYLVWGAVMAYLSQSILKLPILLAILSVFLWFNVSRLPLQTMSWTVTDMERTASAIYDRLHPGEKYQVLLLGPSKDLYAHNYRYYLSTRDNPPVALEKTSEADALVIINEENVADVSQVLIYEISMFPEKNHPEVYTIPSGPQIVVFRKLPAQ